MKKYDIEISGSKTVHKTADSHREILEGTRYAQGRISICAHGREIFWGSREELINAIQLTEEYEEEL